jgi:hypothetical protein
MCSYATAGTSARFGGDICGAKALSVFLHRHDIGWSRSHISCSEVVL